jgi:hypothetical protein
MEAIMDYKEIHQEVYEELKEELGREPTWQEIDVNFRDYMANLVDHYKDMAKHE